ncbi:ERB1 protein, partial [Amazona guildingii]|nr:ERB1 protein [Amazona guildingii]
LWNNQSAKALPPDVFLICGDRAWQGIPKDIIGGPCYLGSVTIFAPKFTELRNLSHILHSRSKRSIGLAPDCNDNVPLLSRAARVTLSLFVPGAAAGNALRTVAQLACWAEKQANVTTAILEELLMDQNSLQHSLLQNRAAIDFLLLAQGHGCKDFEGMCCENLSDHSKSIHKQLTYLKEHSQKIQQDVNPLDDWLRNVFSGWGIGTWIQNWIIIALKALGTVLLILLTCTIVF